MNDPLDLARLLTGAAATVAKAFPEPLRTVLFVVDEGLGLAAALRDAGHEPVGKIAEMRRAVEDFTVAKRRVHDEVDAIVDATMSAPPPSAPAEPPRTPTEPPRTPTEPEGHPAAPDAAPTPPAPADGGA